MLTTMTFQYQFCHALAHFDEKYPSCIFNITNKNTATNRLLVELSSSINSSIFHRRIFVSKLIKRLEVGVSQEISYLKNIIIAMKSIIVKIGKIENFIVF